ncbi:hypothetical protein KIH39_05655 [Telmatocola sphagniphila]|uniref:Uncharacterized protein n=1 Tax=Telmatocola sphagniphila TaxID=1123043 RepID=A0A8E6EZ60_9BACT|nr:hypothetical protein [Telmatocola sphagniphila]QVL33398.1 hypothetical protein KIH39_05655 [Telmatocola sphagniphila]
MDVTPLAKWLKISTTPWPPDYFRLVGLEIGEGTAADIEARVFERMELLRNYQLKYPEQVTEGMNLLAQAMVCLCDSAQRTKYERSLGLRRPEAPKETPKPSNLPIAKLVTESQSQISHEIDLTQEDSLLVARQVQTAFDQVENAASVALQRIDNAPKDPRRLPCQKRSFLRRLIRLLRQFQAMLQLSARRSFEEKQTRMLQYTCTQINQAWTHPFWPQIEWAGQGDRLLSITKILSRFPSLDYLVANQLQDINRDITQTLRTLEGQLQAEEIEYQRLRQKRRARSKFRRRIRQTLWEPELLWRAASLLILGITLTRWMFSK